MKKVLSVLLLAALMMGVFAGCANNKQPSTPSDPQTPSTTDPGSTPSDPKPADPDTKYKDTITIVTSVETSSMDPRMGNSAQNSIPHNFMYDTLFRQDRETGDVVNVLAESYEWVDDTHLKVKIRENAKFSNGDPVTTEDIAYCFARAKEHSTSKSTMSWYDAETTEVVDEHTIILSMYYPYAPVFYVMSNGRTNIGSKKVMEDIGEDEYARNPIGSGPYKMVEWVTGSHMTFTRNEHYWGEPAKTENLVLKIVPEATSRVIELETGGADVAFYIQASDVNRVNDLDGFHTEIGDTERYFLVTLSMEEPLFKDQNVRHALSLAIDKEALVQASFDGAAKVLTGMYSPIVEGFKDFGVLPYDVEESKKLLADAGYPNGFEIELHVQPTTEFERLAVAVQSMWDKVGVKANIVTSELATYEAQKNGQFQAAIRDGNAFEVSNILIIYEPSFGSRLQPNDLELDAMLQTLKQTYDTDERAKQLETIQDYIHEKRYTIPFATVPAIYGIPDKLEGFKFEIPYHLNPWDWQIAE